MGGGSSTPFNFGNTGSAQSQIICGHRPISQNDVNNWAITGGTWYKDSYTPCVNNFDNGYKSPNSQMVCAGKSVSKAEVEQLRTSLKQSDRDLYNTYVSCVTDYEAGKGSTNAQLYCKSNPQQPFTECINEYDNGSGSRKAQMVCSPGRYVPITESYAKKTTADTDYYNRYKPCVDTYDRIARAKAIEDKIIADRVAAAKAIADKIIADREDVDRAAAEKANAERAAESAKIIADKIIADRLAAERAAAERATAERAAAERAAAERAAAFSAAAEKAAADKIIADEASVIYLLYKQILGQQTSAINKLKLIPTAFAEPFSNNKFEDISGNIPDLQAYTNIYNKSIALMDDPNNYNQVAFDTYTYLQNKKMNEIQSRMNNINSKIVTQNPPVKSFRNMNNSQIINVESYPDPSPTITNNGQSRPTANNTYPAYKGNGASKYPNYLIYGNNGCLSYNPAVPANSQVLETSAKSASWKFTACNASNPSQQFLATQIKDRDTYNDKIKNPDNISYKLQSQNSGINNMGFYVINPINDINQCLQLNNDGLSVMPCNMDSMQRFKPMYSNAIP